MYHFLFQCSLYRGIRFLYPDGGICDDTCSNWPSTLSFQSKEACKGIYSFIKRCQPLYTNVLSVRLSVLPPFLLSIHLITFQPHNISKCGLLQLIKDPAEMITIEYGENRKDPYGSKTALNIKLWKFQNSSFFNLSRTPPTCTLLNITNIGRTLKGLKGSLILNYGNF